MPSPTLSHLQRLILTQSGGASRFGLSFISQWQRCPYEAAIAHLAPHPKGGRGLTRQHKARPLLAGGGFHAAIEPWYRSRCINPSTGGWTEDHGQPDLERTMAELDAWVGSHAHEWEDPIERQADHDQMRLWVMRYHDWYGPKGTHPEWPNVKVYVDEDGPWIEKEVVVPVAPGLEYTVRIDLVATDSGHPCVYEHKTAAPSGVRSKARMMHLAAQPSGELYGLQVARQLPFFPTACVVNIINKRPAQRKTPNPVPNFHRERISRTEADIAKFRQDLWRWLNQIETWLGEYTELVDGGMEPYLAISNVFPRTGTVIESCYRYNRACDYWALCSMSGRESASAMAYLPRYREDDTNEEPVVGLYDEEEWA